MTTEYWPFEKSSKPYVRRKPNASVSLRCLANVLAISNPSLLLQLKHSLVFDSASSTKLVHWNPSVDCCSWEGVTCSDGRVIYLNLTHESISSGLDNSSSLFRLEYLQNLSLAYNNFENSEIPSEFDKLTNLSYLNLSNAGFAGQIPIAISRLTRLVSLDLSIDDLIIDSHALQLENPNLNMLVQNLSNLMELYLDGVKISAQGYEWGPALSSSVPKLTVLSLSNCLLSGPLDSSILNLQSLSIIHLDYNNFSAPVPEIFANFKNLMSLDFAYANLTGKFPRKIFQIPTLQMLDLSGNKLLQGSLPEFSSNGSLRTLVLSKTNFSGTLPNSIANLKMLSVINLSGCNFNGSIPKSMASLTRLLYLDMSNNNFGGSIPSFSMVKNLTTISLSKNNLTGEITSTWWEELLNLEILDLSYNSLNGSIPLSLYSIPSLRKLQLFNNRFSGQLTEFSTISSYLLDTLNLGRNNLEGPIPMSVFQLQGLKVLDLSLNNFNGSLQLNVIRTLRNLFYLDLSHNSLVIEYNGTNSSSFSQIVVLRLASCKLKTFPDHFLINQSRLLNLDLSDNQIHGEIPNWIWKLPRLQSLNLSHNYLETRDLPLLNLSSMTFLDLRSNMLQGQLSVFPKHAKYLDFSLNNFSYMIPASIGDSLSVVNFLSLSHNTFYGSIPGSICNATQLFALDLSDNFLNGTVPQCLIEMSKTLGVLNLRRNNLIGAISNMFPSNCSLQSLNLNGNQLQGRLPKSLAKCTSLEVLELGNNHIEDAFPCYLNNISTLQVFILRSNKFYGPIDCSGPNASWPMLQIVDLAANNFTGKLPIKYFFDWKAIMDDKNEASQLNHLRIEDNSWHIYYLDVVSVTMKSLQMELVKILTIFISLDFSCNNFDGPIPEELGELKSLIILNLSHNAFTGQIPKSLGNLTYLESLDLSSNELTGEIHVQLANGLIFLSVLNLSFNRLVGKIPQIKQFPTFSETSFEGNIGLCGFPLKEKCTPGESGSSPPTSKETHLNSGNAIEWKFLSAELGFVFGFGIVIGPLMFWKRWRICYYQHVDDIFFKMLPQLYIRIENRQRRAYKNQARRH
ncbi:receptor-like protein 34 [Corylus avellana]|uniref:receptor-like protein 34 n=1 Tax=Corylus avellana TaxID=13451 RepID=UPI002869F79D|nr:receptor-like protein 34 [Corylus avellana]